MSTYMLYHNLIATVFLVFSPKKSIVRHPRHGYHDFTLFFVDLSSILRFLTPRPSFPNRETVKSSAVGAVTGLRLDLSRESIWICWEWIDIWTSSFQFQAWLHLELLSFRGQWETPQTAQFGVAAIVFYGVSICELALPFQSLKIFLNYGCFQYVSDLDSKEEHAQTQLPKLYGRQGAHILTHKGVLVKCISDQSTFYHQGKEYYNAYQKDIAIVNIFFGEPTVYGELQYYLNQLTPTNETCFPEFERLPKMTWLDFISGFGGLCGLCLGISFVSLAEILYWFSVRLCRKFWFENAKSHYTCVFVQIVNCKHSFY